MCGALKRVKVAELLKKIEKKICGERGLKKKANVEELEKKVEAVSFQSCEKLVKKWLSVC